MNIKVVLLIEIIILSGIATSVSAEGQTNNWMRDYVRLRVMEKNIDSIATNRATLSRAEIKNVLTPRIVGGSAAGATDNP